MKRSKRILLLQLADIGDLVLATPAMAALRDALPEARIDLLASAHAADIVPPDLVDRVFRFDKGDANASRAMFSPPNLRLLLGLRRQRYDAVVCFHHFSLRAGVFKFRLIAKATGARNIFGLRNANADFLTDYVADAGFGAKHEAQYWLDVVALLGADAKARHSRVRHEACPEFDAWRRGKGDSPIVAIHPGSGGYSLARRWMPERFAEVADELRRRQKAEIVILGGMDDDADALAKLLDFDALNLAGKTSLPQLAHVLGRADLFIGADSGVMHLAAAANAPIVAIFGPSNHHAWRPWRDDERVIVLRSGVRCSPCSYVGKAIGARNGCPARTCMKTVTTRQVVDAALRLLAGKTPMAASRPVAPMQHERERSMILGAPVDAVTYAGWLERIERWIDADDGARQVCTVNPEFIMIARGDPIFRAILDRADLCVPDGVGLLWASRKLGAPLPQRVTGSDGVPLIAERAAERGWRLFLLGAAPGIAQRAADTLREAHPALKVAGVHSGSPAERDEDDIVARVNASNADILFVAYGAPQQDKWIARNLARLDVKMAMGVGGSLDFIAGVVPRAPLWMRRLGLEWAFRLARQPWRIRRMLRLPRFVMGVLRESRRR